MSLVARFATSRRLDEPVCFTPEEYERITAELTRRAGAAVRARADFVREHHPSILGHPFLINAEGAARQSLGHSACNCRPVPEPDVPEEKWERLPGSTPCPLHLQP